VLVIKDKFTGNYPKGEDKDSKDKQDIINKFAVRDKYDGDIKDAI
jgi:hypothetical protein